MSDFDFQDEPSHAPARSGGYRTSDTSRILYVILALVLGGFGIHNFAAGRYLRGGLQLFAAIVSPFTLFVLLIPLGLWILIDIITVTTDGKGRRFT